MIDELRDRLETAAIEVPVDALAAIAEGERRLRRGVRRRRVTVGLGIVLAAAGGVALAQVGGGGSTATIAADRSSAADVVAHVTIPKLHLSVDVRDGIGPANLAEGLAVSHGLDLCSSGAGEVFGWADRSPRPFNSLGRLEQGDAVDVTTGGRSCTLIVTGSQLVDPHDTDVVQDQLVLVAHWPKGHDDDAASQRLVVTLSRVDLPARLPSITIPSLGVDKVLLRAHYSLSSFGPSAAAAGPVASGVPLCTTGKLLIFGERTTYGHPFNDLDRLKAGASVTLRSDRRSCTLHVVRSFVLLPSQAAALTGHTYLVTNTPKYSATHRLVVQLSDP